MKDALEIALIQTSLVWEQPFANKQSLEEKLRRLPASVDLAILPEMFTTGFTMNPLEVAETMEGDTLELLKSIAKEQQLAIGGSLIIKEGTHYYNRFVFVHPEGNVDIYNKRHTFTLAGENKVYTAGDTKTIVMYKGWRLCTLICYDLRFPVWARNVEDYDALIYVANWPTPRVEAWDALLKARAIENMSYCMGVNRVGEDANALQYSGHSNVYDMLGRAMAESNNDKEAIIIVQISKSELQKTRNQLGFLKDKDSFNLVTQTQ